MKERNQKKKTNSGSKVWKPKYGERYHYIDGSGSIYSAIWFNSIVDNGRWVLGNVFKTQEEAVFARKKRKVEVELERYAKGTQWHRICQSLLLYSM